MAPKSGSVVNEPRSAVEIAESIKSCRDLIKVADAQIHRGKADLGTARLGLGDELELTSREVRLAVQGTDGEGGQPL